MKQDSTVQKKQRRDKKAQLFKPRKKKSAEEDAAIQYLRAQYERVDYNKQPFQLHFLDFMKSQSLCFMQLF